MIEDTTRLRTLSSLAAEDFDYYQSGEAIFELESQQVYRLNDQPWHAVNNRILVRFNNEV